MLNKKFANVALSIAIAIGYFGSGILPAEAKAVLKNPTKLPAVVRHNRATHTPDVLLVMATPGTEKDEIAEALKEAHGTVIGSIGQGRLKCLIVRTEKGKLEQTEKKLQKNKKFNAVSRNYEYSAQEIPNDPKVGEAWQLPAMNCFKAWDTAKGGGVKIAVFDTGCQATNDDLAGKTEKGYDARTPLSIQTGIAAAVPPAVLPGTYFEGIALGINKGINAAEDNGGGQVDHGNSSTGVSHGTKVATTAAGRSNNNKNSCGIAPNATIFPVRSNSESGVVTDLELMGGFLNIMGKGIKVVNISSGTVPFINFNNPGLHMPLHKYFQEFHYQQGGLIFMSAGNDGDFDPLPRLEYLQMVSAVGQVAGDTNSVSLAQWPNGGGSSYGMSTTFTAPGLAVSCSDKANQPKTVNGTSFSSPICAGIAALIWSANPSLSNTQVLNIMAASCTNSGGLWNYYYGFGMPDAEKAVKMASGK